MSATSQNKELFNDYEGFVEKFKPKKTTDDCYTPPLVYDAVAEWVSEVKIDWQNCLKCGNKNCVETYYRRNPATMEWEPTHGKCAECGCRFIV